MKWNFGNLQKYQEQQRLYQSNWPWSKAFDTEFIKDHQPARSNSKNDADESNLSDFSEYSTEHLPIPQGLIQNFIKGRTAKKNSNHCKHFVNNLINYFVIYFCFFYYFLVAKATCKSLFF